MQNITSKERKKNSGAQTYQEFKPKSILSQSKQTKLCGNSLLMSNNPPQLYNASQDQNVDFFAGCKIGFQTQNSGFTYLSTSAILWKYSLRGKSTLTVTERLMIVLFKLIYC